MTGTRKKKRTPSRIKYDKKHPIVSIRITPELDYRLKAAKKAGRSIADILKIGLGLIEVKTKGEPDLMVQGYNEGFEFARNMYLVTYKCSVCRGEMEVEYKEEKKAIAEYMRQAGWGHGECVGR